MSIVDKFQRTPLTDVVVLRSAGTDPRGYPLPDEEISLDGCLVGWGSTTDPVDRTDVTEAGATLYRRRDGFVWRSTDRVRIPEDSMLPGTWAVDGEPRIWPTDVAVSLTRDGA